MPFNCIPGGFCLCPGAALTCEQAEHFQDSIRHKQESHELRNILKLIFSFCHVPSELPGEPEIPVWGLMPWVQV